ncbi:N-acetylneuraminate synthase [Intrasporangium oryzae NRRL B-24470]|uniref:N-acetylneuraminate synthase n=1 Tax=Intrasporangium oryzae NRRL B-24470 TaxID=1386089 RepID=W9G779_9MICO|nr:pseudaminic acid synthase [Intrasporangium oryzae]EWT01142.1 N-acetylneuraminate synthase [Intrasporangium oryzae NRRL B-24470]
MTNMGASTVQGAQGGPDATIMIGGVPVGRSAEPFIIAEMSGNHDGSLDKALEIVRAAAAAGAHAIKLQTYTADTITIDVDTPEFRLSEDHPLWGGRRLYDLYEEAHTPWEWHQPIFDLAKELGLLAFSSPFDPSAVAFLESLDVPAYKIASSEIVDLPLVRCAAATGKPIIISTGMASVGEIHAAVEAARSTGNDQVIVLSCTASYPADPASSNLRGIPVMADAFGVPVGLSDHTMGIGAAVASIAFGAVLVEKHVTMSRAEGGVDSDFSLEPAELAALVAETRTAWQALGQPRIGARESEREGLRFRRSLYVVEDVKAGDPVTADNVRSIRPANGLAPDTFSVLEGKRFTQDVARGTAMSWELV